MKVLVINSGSSSIKYQVLDMEGETVLAAGLVERIGEPEGTLTCTLYPKTEKEQKVDLRQSIPNHQHGMEMVIGQLTDKRIGVIGDTSEIGAIGHRVVHGGEAFHASTVIDSEVLAAIEDYCPLAPLHNPANLDGIRVAQELFPAIPHVAVFDTAFHQSMPAYAYVYALPYEMYSDRRVRRYGFHGTSHKFISGECAAMLGKPLEECNLITVHLGNGCSMTAVKNGKSVDTSMGLTPLEGLMMGTRSGDVDPAVHAFLSRNYDMELEEIDEMLNKKSGLKGLCGLNDMRDIHDAVAQGDKHARLALQAQTYRNKKYIGAYMAALGRVDAIVFTAGIGENDDIVRLESLRGLEEMGVVVDEAKNQGRKKQPVLISAEGSPVKVFVIPTNEELAIARETVLVIG
ncbi:MAG: acetate kinase [Desulfobulbus propionicus]|nr:MAG: acetate kinase [Desulfobulbus propionicus]